MLPQDFSETFNAAVTSQDWPLVIVLGESAIAEHGASQAMIYNLGLAYLKTSKAPLAISVFLSVPISKQDPNFRAALDEGLRMAGSSKDDFELGAHGFYGAMTAVARTMTAVDPYSWCVSFLGLGILIGLLMALGQKLIRTPVMCSILKFSLGLCVAITAIAGVGIGVEYFYQCHWGSVVSKDVASIRPVPSEKSEASKTLKPGKPVLVLGDVTTPWVHVIESDGGDGWMNAQDLRVVKLATPY
jgi:hypothetical protein